MTKADHQHGEAFSRMQYKCEATGRIEWVWNSRDGVTPFVIPCSCCAPSATAVHIDWQDDQHLHDYTPLPGERFFRDGTVEEALEILRNRRAFWIAQGGDVAMVNRVVDQVMTAVREGDPDGEFTPGWPHLATQPKSEAFA